jgi:hypothetical protein
MLSTPVLQIQYRRFPNRRHTLLLLHEDRGLLKKLAARDVWVSLACWGEATYHAQVQQMLPQLTYADQFGMWALDSNARALHRVLALEACN